MLSFLRSPGERCMSWSFAWAWEVEVWGRSVSGSSACRAGSLAPAVAWMGEYSFGDLGTQEDQRVYSSTSVISWGLRLVCLVSWSYPYLCIVSCLLGNNISDYQLKWECRSDSMRWQMHPAIEGRSPYNIMSEDRNIRWIREHAWIVSLVYVCVQEQYTRTPRVRFSLVQEYIFYSYLVIVPVDMDSDCIKRPVN